ncbi:response regulator [Desulfoferrobacter suflitae]|uniref:response regulator n=1 Tax=Desulfoferrobacter suflitae TaxID=2865782 RepID=UPI0021645F3A|nr:response regulator [Desulfoferrobacter suflitae]MCK8601562.1 response regulator [Desulfoferrobacter suflitae]
MDGTFQILIADRNRHVREFLRRELVSEGYRVLLAKDDKELLGIIDGQVPDVLILDLEIPHGGGLAVLQWIRDRNLSLPVVIHTFLTEYASHPAVQGRASVVEKMANTGILKAAIQDILKKNYPCRFESAERLRDAEVEKES